MLKALWAKKVALSADVYLEVAQSLSIDDFLMVLRLFINRRGSQDEIHSDNGTNFVGADLELAKALADLNRVRIAGSAPPAEGYQAGILATNSSAHGRCVGATGEGGEAASEDHRWRSAAERF